MTKFRWERADEYQQDPGAVVEVPDLTHPTGWIGPREKERRIAERAKRNRALKESSEQHDMDLLRQGLVRRIMAKEARGEELSPFEQMIIGDLVRPDR